MQLSAREEQVVWLIAWGYSNKEIAARLSVSVKTVETYKMRSQEKLGIKTRVQLMQYAASHGLFDKDPGEPNAESPDEKWPDRR
jgi:DNA-binding CsgD family transcriptional regulator